MTGFASSLYLGLRHAHADLRPWASLSAGMPAALALPDGAPAVARALALLLGVEAAVLGTSTLHLLWDLGGQARWSPLRLLADAHLYPVGRWGIERAAAAGNPTATFAHQDAEALERRLDRGGAAQPPPLVITDGLCPDCGRVPPLARYLSLVTARGGWLLLDDSQALGLLGARPSPRHPFGRGGGGSAAHLGIATSPRLLIVASLAKGFGAPLALLAGPRHLLRRFALRSDTALYASPPSVAAVRAAESALAINRDRGEVLRQRLAARVLAFRRRLAAAGLQPRGGLAPVQSLAVPASVDAVALHRRLRAAGVDAVLRRGGCRPGILLTFVLRADHRPEEVESAAATLIRHIDFAPPARAAEEVA